VKQTFTNFPTAHHNLGSSRVTPSNLGSFTSKSNKRHEDCFTKLKCSNHSQRRISQPKLGFLINHSNLNKRCRGKLTKALGMSIFIGGTSSLQKSEGGEAFILAPQKLVIGKLASKNRNIWFWNRNIRNFKYSCYRQNWTLRFGKPDCLIFPSSVRCVVCVIIVFHSSHLGF
jgi:hypothetical protein